MKKEGKKTTMVKRRAGCTLTEPNEKEVQKKKMGNTHAGLPHSEQKKEKNCIHEKELQRGYPKKRRDEDRQKKMERERGAGGKLWGANKKFSKKKKNLTAQCLK